MDDPRKEAIEFDWSVLKATFDKTDISRAPNIYFRASLFRTVGNTISQVTDASGNVFEDELTWEDPEIEFNVSRVPLDQRIGEFTVRVAMCPHDVGDGGNRNFCGSYGAYGISEVLPILPPPPKFVPKSPSYKFQYTES